MSSPIDVELQHFHGDEETIKVTITTSDIQYLGKEASFDLGCEVHVKDDRAVNDRKNIFSKRITLSENPIEFTIPKSAISYYSYLGHKISIEIWSQIKIGNYIIFNEKIREKHHFPSEIKTGQSKFKAIHIIEPHDRFNFIKNLKAIPLENMFSAIGLIIIAAAMMSANTITGIHDQFVSEPFTWFYSHYEADGDRQSPFINSLYASAAIGFSIWKTVKTHLKKYMNFNFKKKIQRINPSKAYRLTDIISGKSYNQINNFKIRIVAGNLEKGQYKRGHGTKERTVTFKEPGRGVIIYETEHLNIPSKATLESILPDEEFNFDKLFNFLYPPQSVSATHGLEIHWEVQLIHDDYIDHELVGSTLGLRQEYFWTGGLDNITYPEGKNESHDTNLTHDPNKIEPGEKLFKPIRSDEERYVARL